MIGTLINTVLVLIGGGLGLLLRKGIPERIRDTIMQGLALTVMLIGIQGAIKTNDVLCVIVSIVVGGLIGGLLDIEKQLDKLGQFAERKLSSEEGSVAKGFVTASLIFCVGAMAIVGAMDSGIRGDHSTLIAKGVIDAVTSVFLAATLGPGVLLSAVAILVYQGAIALLSIWIAPILTDTVICEMGATGGLLVLGIGFNLLFPNQKIKVGNLLPAIFVPLLYIPIAGLF